MILVLKRSCLRTTLTATNEQGKKKEEEEEDLGTVACNPSYSGNRDWEDYD
jgi:hypothetical protein